MNGVFHEPFGATPLDPDEREGLRHKHVTTRQELDELEQTNIEQGLLWLSRRRSREALSERFLRKLHRRLFGDVWRWAGQFRQSEKNIGVDPYQVPVRLRDLIDDARCWVEYATYAPLEAAVRYHHRMVEIHLFPNGNGRHSRIATDVYLQVCYEHPSIDWTAGHPINAASDRRRLYIDALRAADAGDYRLLLHFVGA